MAGVDELLEMQSIWEIIKSWPDDPMDDASTSGFAAMERHGIHMKLIQDDREFTFDRKLRDDGGYDVVCNGEHLVERYTSQREGK